jgi:pimeloyl-ACP methyl ester carboxylesterase
MPSIKAPVVVLAGSKDRTVPLSNTEALRPLLKPGDRYEIVEGGRHNSLGTFPQYDALLDQVLR